MSELTKTVSISTASKMSGITTKQLRYWEEKGIIPSLVRIDCGERSFRQYDMETISLLKKIKGFIDDGYTLRIAAKKAIEKM